MSSPHSEGPVCDFCEIAVDEGETLEPIFVGEPKEPEPHRFSTVQRKNRVSPEMRILGYHGEALAALYATLEGSPNIDIEVSNRVEEVQKIGGGSRTYESQIRDDKVGVSVEIRPKDVEYEPDAEVCDTCAEMFRSLGNAWSSS